MRKRSWLFITVHLAWFSICPVLADQPARFETQSMTPETALQMARGALTNCRSKNYQVSVAVLDRHANIQVILRDRLAGPSTPDVAQAKARTALNIGLDTRDAIEGTQAGEAAAGIRDIPGVVIIAGGVRVMAAGHLVGAIGVSGAPGGEADDGCARAGIKAVQEQLDF